MSQKTFSGLPILNTEEWVVLALERLFLSVTLTLFPSDCARGQCMARGPRHIPCGISPDT